MSRNDTPSPPSLTARQKRALDQLVAGATITAAARSASVHRSTVHRWLREDFDFQAAYNGYQNDLRREVEGRLLQLAHSASDTLAAAIEQGDVRAALAVLKGVGALSGSAAPIPGEIASELAENAQITASERASERLMRKLTVL